MVGVGRDLESLPVPPPAIARDTFHSPRFLQVPSNLVSDTSRDPRAATAAVGNLVLPGTVSLFHIR